ncbi:condensation domain-containing protein [Nonomuraea sp. NPDC002799]
MTQFSGSGIELSAGAGLHTIEQLIAQYPGVACAVVLIYIGNGGNEHLVTYAEVEAGISPPSSNDLRAFLAEYLPRVAIPDVVMFLEAMPRLLSGDVDRAALPEPGSYLLDPVRSVRSELLRELIANVLGRPTVAMNDNFFELGGQSLLAGRLVSIIRSVTGLHTRVSDLYDTETIGSLLERLDQRDEIQPPLRRVLHSTLTPACRPQEYAVPPEQENRALHPVLASALRFTGALDCSGLEHALADVVRRHKVLQALQHECTRAIGPVVSDVEAGLDMAVIATSEKDLLGRLNAEVAHRSYRGCDVPLRAVLFTLEAGGHVLLLVADRELCDQHSMEILWRELAYAYTARFSDREPVWDILPLQFADYTHWRAMVLGKETEPGSVSAQQLEYWRAVLAELPTELTLPFDRPRPEQPTYCGGRVPIEVSPELLARLRAVAKQCNATLLMVLQAGLGMLITRVGGGIDIPIGMPVNKRSDIMLNPVVGCFRSNLVLRLDTSDDPSLSDLVTRARRASLAASSHHHLPFQRLVEEFHSNLSYERHPLFQVSIELDNISDAELLFPSLSAERLLIDAGFELDLSITLHESFDAQGSPSGLRGGLRYATDLFDHTTASRMATIFVQLLAAATACPARPIGDLQIVEGSAEPSERKARLHPRARRIDG